MDTKIRPYQAITPELSASGLLVTIKQSAADESACESTLKANAKARRLPAYQAYFGSPVMVLPSDVEAFLKSRPDIASKHHPKASPAEPSVAVPLSVAKPNFRSDSPFPNTDPNNSFIGDFGIVITLRSLAHSTPSERALVAKAFFEVARQINETVPADSGNQS